MTPTNIEQNDDGTMSVSFTPQTVGIYNTDIFWNGRKVHGCPYTVLVSDSSKCVAHGEGLYQARLNEAACFEVTTIGAGPGNVSGRVMCRGEEIPIGVEKVEDNTYKGQYYPDSLDDLHVHVLFNDTPVRGSPFTVKVCDPSKVQFRIIDSKPVKVGSECTVSVELEDEAGHGDVTCAVKSPCGTELPVMIIDNGKHSKRIHFKPKVHGIHSVTVFFGRAPLAGCPYNLDVLQTSDVGKVIAAGDGLHQGKSKPSTPKPSKYNNLEVNFKYLILILFDFIMISNFLRLCDPKINDICKIKTK